MATMTNASMMIGMTTEEIKKVNYEFLIRGRRYNLVKVWRDDILLSEVVLNEIGYNITAPLIVEELKNIIEEESK